MLKRPKDNLFTEPSELEKELKKTKEALANTKLQLDNTKSELWKVQQELFIWERLADDPMKVVKEFANKIKENNHD